MLERGPGVVVASGVHVQEACVRCRLNQPAISRQPLFVISNECLVVLDVIDIVTGDDGKSWSNMAFFWPL